MGASTGTLLVPDDEGVGLILRNINRRGTFHSEDEYRLAERRPLGPYRRLDQPSGGARRRIRHSLNPAAGEAGPQRWANASTSFTSPPPTRSNSSAINKDVASVELTPQHLTLAAPGGLRAAKRLCPDEPADPRRAPPRGPVARPRHRRRRRARLRSRARTPSRRRRGRIRLRHRACRACRPCCQSC